MRPPGASPLVDGPGTSTTRASCCSRSTPTRPRTTSATCRAPRSPPRAAPAYPLPEPDATLRAGRDHVLERYVDPAPGVLVVDCRSPAEFDGHVTHAVDVGVDRHRVSGHIPGARNLPSDLLLDDDGLFRPAADLRELFAEVGLVRDADVMVYCRVSERSALLWFVLHELLGHERVRHYDGGWAEYGSLVDVPVVRGTE